MPSKSAKQHRLMAMVANDPKAAKRLGIPQSVGRDYVKADKGHKFGSGGFMKESKAMMRKEVSFMKKKGAPKSMIKHEEAEMEGKKMPKFAAGGMGLQKRQFGTGPGLKPMPKHIGKAITDRGKAIMARPTPKFAAGGKTPYVPGAAMARLQSKIDAANARRDAFRQANSVEARAAAQRAARAAPPPTPPAKPSGIGSMPGASGEQASAQLQALKNSAGFRASAAPSGGMGGAGGTQAMMRKGGMAGSYRKAADGVAHKGKTKGTTVKMREGGSVFRKSADGIASKGKTKGTMVKMAYGGKC
jgi:hypothetical protein